ncbi:hypothetical protein F4802DRAFT_364555 [Xylaria palmicola]|nr:hypothetical protein F4802DRAFT_364555 [Xylaria palmicola]
MKGGMSLVTTLPAPIVQPRPIVTPARTMTFPPSQQSSPIVMGAPSSGPFRPLRTLGSVGWFPEKKEQLGPISVRSPTVIGHVSIQVELLLIPSLRDDHTRRSRPTDPRLLLAWPLGLGEAFCHPRAYSVVVRRQFQPGRKGTGSHTLGIVGQGFVLKYPACYCTARMQSGTCGALQ